ncbi:hypothetical protein [Microbispora sp. ATCC PTA-5024]|uniref:hypothetical protein n=1 Tax=Microbispora sp. ATCC PTA-5024 TaxID=316330 RepID=UPI0003DD94A8|nr:hypothetical protein [Microbispora sp. ATCC PTA-5024]ETK31028.1 hypothetical protein MPTA5024_37210 [Microbispora sp. ATCC PTA-5024]
MSDARIRMRYLDDVLRLLYPSPGGRSPRTVLPHRLAPRRLVPRTRWHAALGRPVLVSDGPDTIETYLSGVLGRPVTTVVRVRAALRDNRKPVLEAYGDATLLGFVKIGDTERARTLVRHEAAVLEMLAGLPLKVVTPPVVRHHGVWRGLDVLLLSPLPVTSRRVPADLFDAAVREIAAIGPHASIDPAAEATAHPRGCHWHGDLSPWNIAPAPDGRLLVWDWERFGCGVPLGFDALHHFFHRALRRMRPPQAARACLAQSGRVLEPFALSTAEARRTAVHYLVTLADRHYRDGHEPLGPPSEWLSPLVDHLETLI